MSDSTNIELARRTDHLDPAVEAFLTAAQSKLSFSEAIDSFLLYLAVERGLSANYQFSNRRSLQEMSNWTRNQPPKHRNRLMKSKQMANQLIV